MKKNTNKKANTEDLELVSSLAYDLSVTCKLLSDNSGNLPDDVYESFQNVFYMANEYYCTECEKRGIDPLMFAKPFDEAVTAN